MKKRLEGALEAEKRRNDRQQSRYKVLDDLAQANPDAVKSLLSQARAQVDLAKIREEFVRRVIDLPKLASEGIGAVRTFAMRGVSALTSWGGMDKVNWKQVEVDTYYDHADRPVEALDAIIAHSPRMADPAVRTAQEGVRDRVIKAQQEAELRAAQQAEEQRARQEAIQRERQEAERRAAPQNHAHAHAQDDAGPLGNRVTLLLLPSTCRAIRESGYLAALGVVSENGK